MLRNVIKRPFTRHLVDRTVIVYGSLNMVRKMKSSTSINERTKKQYQYLESTILMGNCNGNCVAHVVDNIGPVLHSKLDGILPTNTNGECKYTSLDTAIYSSLPKASEKHRVVKVYDGDTATLEGGQRVRLLGVDTPEIKQNEAYAKEARDFLSGKILDQYVHLSFEDNNKEDRYGRLLAWLFVETEGGYLNMNEALVINGLAKVYNPNGSKSANHNKMLAMQKSARQRSAGTWSNFVDSNVFKTKFGKTYHKNQQCTHLSRSKRLMKTTASEALDIGLSGCRTCYGL